MNSKIGWSPGNYVVYGVAAAVLTGLLVVSTADAEGVPAVIGFVGWLLSGIWLAIGVVGKGVEVGMRWFELSKLP